MMTWPCSSGSVATGPGPKRRHRLAGASVALLLLPLAALARAQGPDAGRAGTNAPTDLSRVRIEATQLHALRLRVDRFVLSVVAQPWGDALDRWTTPICPLVGGLPKAEGELILERISKAAIDARAPLAGRVCRPNLFVVASGSPDLLLKKWWARDRTMYNDKDRGVEAVERFVHSGPPVRAWYNTYEGCGAGAAATPTLTSILVGSLSVPLGYGPPACGSVIPSHLIRMATGSNISSAIVVVDGHQLNDITMGQMADYVALVGLAGVQLHADPGSTPSILELFGHGTAPQGLTRWDRALLYALYNTNPRLRTQVSEVEITMARRLARQEAVVLR